MAGTHTYAEEGTYNGTVTVSCNGTPATDSLSATVSDAPLNSSGMTVNATATLQFSGPVATFTDADPGGTPSDYAVTIDWGDGSSTSSGSVTGPVNGTFTVNGTHTYATKGTYSIFVTITDQSAQGGTGGQSQSQTFASSTANVGPAPPMFKQCPPVGSNTGCQFLVVVSNSGQTILEDPNQGPYEGAEDALIGVQNNSSQPINALPLSAPGLFSFDGDGLCNPGSGPVAPGCRVAPGEQAGTTCGTQGDACSFPPPAGEPFGYRDVGAISPNTQNGYEGPTSWFSNVSLDASSGHVNFSPPIEPGQTTYFSLEEPPTANALIVGGRIQPYVPPPVLGKFFDVYVVSGIVYVKLPARFLRPAPDLSITSDPLATDAIVKGQGFVPLTEARQLPAGSEIDARQGKIKLVAATGRGHRTEFGTFSGGIFGLSQDRRGRLTKGLMNLSLVESAFPGAPSYRACRARGASDGAGPAASAAGLSGKVLQTLRGKAHGRFRIIGRFSAATVRGTVWGVRDRCNGTLTIVTRGVVAVTDFVRHVTVFVHAGHSYLARRP